MQKNNPSTSGRVPLIFHTKQVEFRRISMPIKDEMIEDFRFLKMLKDMQSNKTRNTTSNPLAAIKG